MKKEIDIVILSYAKNYTLKNLTEQAISSLIASEDSNFIEFNITVIESNMALKPFQYIGTSTIYPKTKFGYNRYLNIGIKNGKAANICLCNNDLIFHKRWASEILTAFNDDSELVSASPICSILSDEDYYKINSGNYYGYSTRREVSGWCIFLKREIIPKIGKFDEKIKFWFSDTDYVRLLELHNLKHALITSSIVDHLESKTLSSSSQEKISKLTNDEFLYYDYKWNHKSLLIYYFRLGKRILKRAFLGTNHGQ